MQVESTVIKGFLRANGIAIGGLLGLAASLSGTLMESPYYLTAMLVLLVSFVSMTAAVAEFRCAALAGAGVCTHTLLTVPRTEGSPVG